MRWGPVIAFASLGVGVLVYYLTVVDGQPKLDDVDAPDMVVLPTTTSPSHDESGFSFNAHAEPRVLPEVTFVDGGGRPSTLAAFRGRVVLLNIWATWCGPCREEMPTLDRLQALLGSPEFEVVALSIDRDGLTVVKDFYAELALESLSIYVDATNSAPANLSIIGVPATLLIDREGKEIGRVLGPAEWDSPAVVKTIRGYLPDS